MTVLQVNQRRFSSDSDYAAFAVVRIHNTQLAALGGRNAWVRIESQSASVYRTVCGSGALPGFPPDGIELDYDTSVELGLGAAAAPSWVGAAGERPFFPCALQVRPLRKWEVLRAHWKHLNPAYRIPLQISIALGGVSIALGVVGVALGVISLL